MSVSKKVVKHVAKNTEQEPTELPVLYEIVDPDALDRFVAIAKRNNTPLSVQFTYAGQTVTIDQSMAIRCTKQ